MWQRSYYGERMTNEEIVSSVRNDILTRIKAPRNEKKCVGGETTPFQGEPPDPVRSPPRQLQVPSRLLHAHPLPAALIGCVHTCTRPGSRWLSCTLPRRSSLRPVCARTLHSRCPPGRSSRGPRMHAHLGTIALALV
jgi:hypothetical protein